MKGLTKRQAEVLLFVRLYMQEHERPPTRAEIAKGFGFKSANAAQEHLKALQKKGFVGLYPLLSRAINPLLDAAQ